MELRTRVRLTNHWRKAAGPGIILAAALVAIAPLLAKGPSCGIDFLFHFTSWHDAQNSWRQGIVYPQWTPSANFGAGEPRFIFYPPLVWMLGAALGLLMPWPAVPVALSFLLFAAAGMATRALARQALSEGAATLAGCIAIFSGYAQLNLYVRSDFPELTGGLWIPLMLLFLLRGNDAEDSVRTKPLWRRALDGSAAPLAVVIAGAWLSNAPVGLMASYLLAAAALSAAFVKRSWAPVLRAAAGSVVGVGMAAFYLVPAIWEQRWVDIRQAITNPKFVVQNRWLFGSLLHPAHLFHSMEPTKKYVAAGVAMFAAAFGGLVASWLRGKLEGANSPAGKGLIPRAWWTSLALISILILFLQFPESLPVWRLLPKLQFLQFPWRWLIALQAPMAIFLALAIWPGARRWRMLVIAACAVVFIAISAASGRYLFLGFGEWDRDNPRLPVMEAALEPGGEGVRGVPEYASPPGASNGLLPIGLPQACFVVDPSTVLGKLPPDALHPVWTADQHSCLATFKATADPGKGSSERLRVVLDPEHAGYLILRLRSYPAWEIRVNGRPVTALKHRDDGLMAIPVPAAPVDLNVDWSTTPDVRVGRWISGLALLLLAGLWLGERRLRRGGLSS